MGTIAPDAEQPAQQPSRPLNHTVGDELLTHEGEGEANLHLVSKAALEHSGATDDSIMAQPRGSRKITMDEAELDRGDDLGEIVIMPLQDLASQIAVQKTSPASKSHQQESTHPEVPQYTGVEDPGDDILPDAKLYQDTAVEYPNAYQAFEQKYSEQALLMEEVSGSLTAAEVQASQKQQELIELQKKAQC